MSNVTLHHMFIRCILRGKTAVLKDLDRSVSPKGAQLTVMVSDVTRDLRSDHEAFRRHVSFKDHAYRTSMDEYIQTIEYGGNFYSVRKRDVDEALQENKYVLVDCIPDGVRQFAKHHPTKAAFIFAWPRELCKRHLLRGSSPQEMRWRLANAEVELRAAIESGLYDLYINNTDLEEAKRRVWPSSMENVSSLILLTWKLIPLSFVRS